MLTSHELADLAGTTVRALRHYHAIGVLPEPPRAANGYRQYAVEDLVALLRIRSLTALGLSLEHIGQLLAEQDSDDRVSADAVLDELDASLAEQIARLRAQRQVIQSIRRAGSDLDMPVELADTFRKLRAAGVGEADLEQQKRLALVLAHLRPSDGLPVVRELLDVMASGENATEALALSRRVEQLDDNSASRERRELVNDLVQFISPVLQALASHAPQSDAPIELRGIIEAVTFGGDQLNSSQRVVMRQVEKRLQDELDQHVPLGAQ